MERKFYKVVAVRGRKQKVSSIYGYLANDTDLVVIYRLNRWSYPTIEGSRLFVFSSLVAANDFRSSTQRIFECGVKDPVDCAFLLDLPMSMDQIKKWWRGKDLPSSFFKDAPRKTVTVSAVKLLKDVTPSDWKAWV